MRGVNLRSIICPLTVMVEGCRVHILEVVEMRLPGNKRMYHVTVSINDGKPFFIDVKDTRELINKLKIELAKFKLIKLVLGNEFANKLLRW